MSQPSLIPALLDAVEEVGRPTVPDWRARLTATIDGLTRPAPRTDELTDRPDPARILDGPQLIDELLDAARNVCGIPTGNESALRTRIEALLPHRGGEMLTADLLNGIALQLELLRARIDDR